MKTTLQTSGEDGINSPSTTAVITHIPLPFFIWLNSLISETSDCSSAGYSTRTWGRQLTIFENTRSARPETYSRIGLLRGYGNLQSYWNTTKILKLTVVLEYHEAIETYSRIGPIFANTIALETPREAKK